MTATKVRESISMVTDRNASHADVGPGEQCCDGIKSFAGRLPQLRVTRASRRCPLLCRTFQKFSFSADCILLKHEVWLSWSFNIVRVGQQTTHLEMSAVAKA